MNLWRLPDHKSLPLNYFLVIDKSLMGGSRGLLQVVVLSLQALVTYTSDSLVKLIPLVHYTLASNNLSE